MRQTISTLLLGIMMLFVGCQKPTPEPKPEQKEPVLTLTSEATMEFSVDGGEGIITYTLENANEGVELTANCTADWVADLTVAENITFEVVANEGEAREATIKVEYDTQSFEVVVKQAAFVAPEPEDIIFTSAKSSWSGADHLLTLTTEDASVALVADIYTYNPDYGYLYEGEYTVKNSGVSFAAGEIDYYYSSYTFEGEKSQLASGTINVAINDDLTYIITIDVVDALGRELKSEYNGAVEGMSFTNGFKWVAASRNKITGGAAGQFNITFKTAGTDYADYLTLDFYAEEGCERLPAGTYTINDSRAAGSIDLSTLSFTTFSNGTPVIDGGEVVVEYNETEDKYSVVFRMTEYNSRRVWECTYDGTIYNMIIEVKAETLTFVSANGSYSDDSGETSVYLVADNGNQLKLGLLDLEWKKEYVTPGVYTVGSNWAAGEIYSGWYGADWNSGIGFKQGTATFEDNGDATYTITVELTLTNNDAYEGVYVGAIEGLTLPEEEVNDGSTKLHIDRAEGRKYNAANNFGAQLFTPGSSFLEAGEGQDVAYINIDLYNLTDGLTYIAPGVYTAGGTGKGEMDPNYTEIVYASYKTAKLKEGTSEFAINDDGTYTVKFNLKFTDGKHYSGSYTGELVGLSTK